MIASISLDHTDRLGETIEEIAAEKAGIVKEECPLITGVSNEEAMWVLRHKAIEKHTAIFDALESPCEILEETVEGTRIRTEVLKDIYEFTISMVGRHQVQNALTALTAIALLNKRGDFKVTDEQIAEGFKRAKQIGRFEIMKKNPYVILDGAHRIIQENYRQRNWRQRLKKGEAMSKALPGRKRRSAAPRGYTTHMT